jgi:hypothetical protein
LSLLFKIHIKLEKSKDYLKATFVLFLITLYTLLNSGLPDFVIFIGVIVVLANTISCLSAPYFEKYDEIIFNNAEWTLVEKSTRNEIIFEEGFISFECGLFILLTFKNNDFKRNMVVFLDQITPHINRELHLLMRKNIHSYKKGIN